MPDVYHALGLHLHQPLGNLVALHNSGESWEAKQILWCYDRPTRMLEGFEEVARLHLSMSGTLLKQLEDEGCARRSCKRQGWEARGISRVHSSTTVNSKEPGTS